MNKCNFKKFLKNAKETTDIMMQHKTGCLMGAGLGGVVGYKGAGYFIDNLNNDSYNFSQTLKENKETFSFISLSILSFIGLLIPMSLYSKESGRKAELKKIIEKIEQNINNLQNDSEISDEKKNAQIEVLKEYLNDIRKG